MKHAPLGLWHSRLGHTSLSQLKPLINIGQLGLVSSRHFECMSCQMGKQIALPFPISNSFASTPFDLVYFDA